MVTADKTESKNPELFHRLLFLYGCTGFPNEFITLDGGDMFNDLISPVIIDAINKDDVLYDDKDGTPYLKEEYGRKINKLHKQAKIKDLLNLIVIRLTFKEKK